MRACVDMGIFDSILGKKDESGEIKVVPSDGSFTIQSLKKTEASKISRVDIMFNTAQQPDKEPSLIRDVLEWNDLIGQLLPDVVITTTYGTIPGIKEFIASKVMPEDLNAFVMARAMLKGIASGPTQMGKIQVNSFSFKDITGLVILKEA